MTTREENLKKINDRLEQLSDEELEKVAGGTRGETLMDGDELWNRGLLDVCQALHAENVRDILHKMGYTGYKCFGDNEGNLKNIYTDKNGNVISRDQFWRNFDKENGTKIIPFDRNR